MEEAELLEGQFIEVVQSYIETAKESGEDISKLSDGYHSFEELYEFRKVYNACLFNEWAKNYDPDYSGLHKSDFPNYSKIGHHYNVHKSWKHYDGEPCFGGGWFIVCAKLPSGVISNHYPQKTGAYSESRRWKNRFLSLTGIHRLTFWKDSKNFKRA